METDLSKYRKSTESNGNTWKHTETRAFDLTRALLGGGDWEKH